MYRLDIKKQQIKNKGKDDGNNYLRFVVILGRRYLRVGRWWGWHRHPVVFTHFEWHLHALVFDPLVSERLGTVGTGKHTLSLKQ